MLEQSAIENKISLGILGTYLSSSIRKCRAEFLTLMVCQVDIETHVFILSIARQWRAHNMYFSSKIQQKNEEETIFSQIQECYS